MIYLSTWMYEESESDGGLYAQLGGATILQSKKLIYWRCVMVFFTLANQHIKNRNDVRLCLFTNAVNLPNLYGVDLRQYLSSLGVQIIPLAYRWRPNFPIKHWYNQFYVFDILDYFEIHAEYSDHFIIADSDCFVAADLNPTFESLKQDGYLTLNVGLDADENINGISRREAATIYGMFGGLKQPLIAPYFGGEFFGISGALLGHFLAIGRDAMRINNRRAGSGMIYFTEEAHLLSYIFIQLNVSVSNADRYIRRIWTSWRFNNTSRDDLNLAVWHVPSEKILGAATLSKIIARALRKGKQPPVFSASLLSRKLGVGGVFPLHLLVHFVLGAIRRLKSVLNMT